MTRTLLAGTASRLAIALALAGAAPAPAHDGNSHVMGTVKAVRLQPPPRTVTVETREGKSVTVLMDDDTKYLRLDGSAQPQDVVPGIRVVIDAATVDGRLTAKEIRLPRAKRK